MYKKIVILMTLCFFSLGCKGNTSDELYADGVKLLREGNSNGAIVFFRKSLEKNQNNLNARYQLAKTYESTQKYELAEKEFQKVKRLNPAQPDIQLEMAYIFNVQGKPDLAISEAEEYLKSKRDSVEAMESIGIAYGIKNMPALAETYFLRALDIKPENQSTLLELAALRVKQGKVNQAKILLENVIKNNPRNLRANDLLADTEIALGRKEKALELYKKGNEINVADPAALYRAGLQNFKIERSDIVEIIAGELVNKFSATAEGDRLKGIVSYHKKDFTDFITHHAENFAGDQQAQNLLAELN
ncbi:MAG: tetratricopeptide repeat protein [Desulfuromonadaceae bacterium]|nr:tetratricopeptide repeat protein [Desulfuromonadaceae bacterium]